MIQTDDTFDVTDPQDHFYSILEIFNKSDLLIQFSLHRRLIFITT